MRWTRHSLDRDSIRGAAREASGTAGLVLRPAPRQEKTRTNGGQDKDKPACSLTIGSSEQFLPSFVAGHSHHRAQTGQSATWVCPYWRRENRPVLRFPRGCSVFSSFLSHPGRCRTNDLSCFMVWQPKGQIPIHSLVATPFILKYSYTCIEHSKFSKI